MVSNWSSKGLLMSRKPFTYSPVTLIEGEPRSGKTNTAVARVVDAYKKDPETKIFANFTLYGVKYVQVQLVDILSLINSKILTDGYVLIDEAYTGLDARSSGAMLTQIITYLGMQAGKRAIRLIIIIQHGRMLEWRMRWLGEIGEHIYCSYNEKNRMITLMIRSRKYKRPRELSYYAPPYWKYYDTEEIMPIPEAKIAKALAASG